MGLGQARQANGHSGVRYHHPQPFGDSHRHRTSKEAKQMREVRVRALGLAQAEGEKLEVKETVLSVPRQMIAELLRHVEGKLRRTRGSAFHGVVSLQLEPNPEAR